ncbi:MAG: type III-B CRISPR-associated protein Cas10/Cmr2 [Armatimonadetes bacterium]|nr:type III-B CRISPR-associated protein Cas10/Cmr2 [Armatimonadota bacterium]
MRRTGNFARPKGLAGRKFWQTVAPKLLGHVEQDGSERLCAICAIKRFVQPFVFRDELGITGDFPSTDSIAAASFARTVLEKWGQVSEKVKALLSEIGQQRQLSQVARTEMDIPKLTEDATKISKDAREFVRLDGEWLFVESYDRERLERAHGVRLSEEEVQRLRKALSELYEVAKVRPTDYYAILLMDGDRMGMWLSGMHESLEDLEAVIHPEAVEQLRGNKDWQEVLKKNRLISPSLHAAISKALADFALNCVPFVVEQIRCGRLVYAGGDDVLAFLPIDEVLPAARELRALFSGEAERKPDGSIEVGFGCEHWTGWVDWNGRRLLTMGNKATASIGIVIAHRLHPLRDALQQAREAEEEAKEHYGRNAICVRWLKRSGERVQMGAKFAYRENGVSDTIKLLLKVKAMMEEKSEIKLTKRFAMALMEEAATLAHLPTEAQEAELLRLLRRHSVSERSSGEREEKVLKELAHQLAQLARALDSHFDEDKVEDPYDLTKPQRGLLELAKWLTLMRFLAGGGE